MKSKEGAGNRGGFIEENLEGYEELTNDLDNLKRYVGRYVKIETIGGEEPPEWHEGTLHSIGSNNLALVREGNGKFIGGSEISLRNISRIFGKM